MTPARYLDARGVADYMSISRAMVDILVTRGILPPAIELTPRLKRWDREAIDAALARSTAYVQPSRDVDAIVRGIGDDLAKGRPARSKAPSGRH